MVTSPFSLAWWMASGPILIRSLGWPGIAGLFVSIILYGLAFTYGVRWIGARVKHVTMILGYASVALLTAFGILFCVAGARLLTGRGF